MKKVSTYALAICLTAFICGKAQALIDVPTLRLAFGPSPISFKAGNGDFKDATPLSSLITINPMFLWDVPSVRMRLGVHFLTDIGSKYGFVSTAGVGLTGIFYPLGLSSSREVNDNFSEIIKTRISPYFQFSLTPMKFSVTKPLDKSDPRFNTPSSYPYFSSRVLEYSMGLGVDYPMYDDLVLFGGVHYRSAAFTADESGKGAISYNGLALLIGIITNFD